MENPTLSPTNVVERKVISFYWRAPAPPQLSQRKRLWHIRREKVNYQKHPRVFISHQFRGNFSELSGGRGTVNGEEWLLRTHSTGTAQSLFASTALVRTATKTACDALVLECIIFTSKKRGNVHLEEFHSQGGKRIRRAQCKETLAFLTCPGARDLYLYWTLCLAQGHSEVSKHGSTFQMIITSEIPQGAPTSQITLSAKCC